MIDLDDAAAIMAADPAGMLGAVARLGEDAEVSYAVGRATKVALPDPVSSVVVCGMGGSAVAGDVLRAIGRDRLAVPVEVHRGHGLPAYAGPNTVVVASSYSGSTSETLSAFEEAVTRGCSIVVVTSGGTLGERSSELGLPVVPVPGGGQPRAALGHLAFAICGALVAGGLMPVMDDDVAETAEGLRELAVTLAPELAEGSNPAKELAGWIGERVPVIWGADGIGAVAAMRWKTQLNENGKVPAWHATMSELDHNEVVGWVEPYGSLHAIVALRLGEDHPEIAARFALTARIAEDAGAAVREVGVEGRSPLARLMRSIMFGDMVSCYVGIRRGYDPTPVDVITRLKAALSDR